MEYVDADFFEFMEDLPIYVDGSCFNGTVPELAAAGAEAIQLSADGQLITIKIQVPKPGSREYARKG